MVVLSACETGMIDLRGAPNEFKGFVSTFLQMGASNVVASLWKVSDLTTCLLMGLFYENLLKNNGHSVSGSLVQAQRWLSQASSPEIIEKLKHWNANRQIDDAQRALLEKEIDEQFSDEDTPFEHPYYWAGFVCYGL